MPEKQQAPDPGRKQSLDDESRNKEREIRDKMMDKTLADSFPASDPPSTIPNPAEDDDVAA